MKKALGIMLFCALLLPLAACAPAAVPAAAAAQAELNVFAAASLTEALIAAASEYKTVAPNVILIFTFDSSGTLKTQIAEGAVCDLFISAAQKQMNQLDITSAQNEDQLDFIIPESRVDLLENKVVLVVPEGNPAGVQEFGDLALDQVETIALGNADVPVGQYAEEILTNLGLWESLQSKISFGSNVKEVTTWVSENMADCGVVYSTDATAAGLTVVAEAPAELLQTPVVYPAAVLKGSQEQQVAADFLAWLQSPDGVNFFTAAGFAIPD